MNETPSLSALLPSQDQLLEELAAAESVRSILDVVCQTTGMGFAAVAHVTESRWVACQVRDDIGFGLPPGGELPVKSTLCDTVRGTRESIVINEVATDPVYRDHHTPALYQLQSYIAVPVILSHGEIFGTLCAIDPQPRTVDTPQTRGMFMLFAQLIATLVERMRLAAEGEALEQRVVQTLAEKKVYADIIESSTAAVTALDLDYRILAINQPNVEAFERVYGRRPEIGDDFLALFAGTPDHAEQQRQIWSRALSGDSFVIVQEFGEERYGRRCYEVHFSPLLDGQGQRIGASSTSYDVTDRIAAERQLMAAQEQLRQAQKMEAIGQLTGGVAHDFNNLLTPIVGSLDILNRKGLGGEREQRLIAGAMQSAERARTLVHRLLAFARRQPLQPSAVDAGALVAGMGQLIASTIGPQVRLSLDIADGLPPVHADENQVEMALLNLAVNARDAMPDGGELRISVSSKSLKSGHPSGLTPASYLRFSVIDSGYGMDEATLARAIEPFFSTKGVGKGTGLGLSMVDGLARQLGGALTLESKLGTGTRVDLWLPESAAPLTENAETQIADSAPHGPALVLLVDDEELVRISTADMLIELGYQVAEASSAEAALTLLREGLRPDILVTDHLMPGMTGADLARTFVMERPGLPVLIVSGYTDVNNIGTDFPRLVKPFRMTELGNCLSSLRTASRA